MFVVAAVAPHAPPTAALNMSLTGCHKPPFVGAFWEPVGACRAVLEGVAKLFPGWFWGFWGPGALHGSPGAAEKLLAGCAPKPDIEPELMPGSNGTCDDALAENDTLAG